MLARVLLVAGHRGRRGGLPDLQYLDASVRPLPDLDRHVLRAEDAADAHPPVLPVDKVTLQLLHLEQSPPDLVVAAVAVYACPEGHVVELSVIHGDGAAVSTDRRKLRFWKKSCKNQIGRAHV